MPSLQRLPLGGQRPRATSSTNDPGPPAAQLDVHPVWGNSRGLDQRYFFTTAHHCGCCAHKHRDRLGPVIPLLRCLRQVGGVTGAIPVGSLCLAFFVLVVLGVVKSALLSMLTSDSRSGRKEEGEHMKHSFCGTATGLLASVSEVVLGLGTSLLASAALTSGS